MWTDKRSRGINQYRECQFIRLEGSSDGEMSDTNLFNSLILHFNPSLIPSLLRSGCLSMPEKEGGEGDSKQRRRGIKIELELGGLKRRKEQIPDMQRRKVEEEGGAAVEEEKWLVYGALWHAAISGLDLQCGAMGCERQRGNKATSMRADDKLI